MSELKATAADVKAAADWVFANVEGQCHPRAAYLAGALAERSKRTWQPISTAPKDGTLILVSWAGSGVHPIVSRWLKNAEAWTHPFNKPVNPPTHWMPLPESPST